MKKVYFFSEKLNFDFLTTRPDLSTQLDIVPFQGLSPEDALTKEFDCILLAEGDFDLFKPVLGALSWKTSHTGVADTLVRIAGGYKPLNLNADCILQALRNKNWKLNTSQSVMVIGSYDFVLSVTSKIALAGYADIIVALFEKDRMVELEKRVKEFIFDLSIKSIELNELTGLQTTSGLLISNVTKKMAADAFEALTYFNFLANGAIFIDCQSYSDTTLIEEAKRAELKVIEELEILTLKYESLI